MCMPFLIHSLIVIGNGYPLILAERMGWVEHTPLSLPFIIPSPPARDRTRLGRGSGDSPGGAWELEEKGQGIHASSMRMSARITAWLF
jgi:hypothetical protein